MQGDILRRTRLHFLLIALLGLIIYSNTFHATFHYDGGRFIEENPFIKDIGYFMEPSRADDLKYLMGTDTLLYLKTRYVGFLTLWANYRLHGLEVVGYHTINLALHIFNAALVYLLVTLTFRSPLIKRASFEAWPVALFTGLMFVAHPLQTEGVTYILSRFVLLVTMFSLLSIVFYIKWRLKTDIRINNQESEIKIKENLQNNNSPSLIPYFLSLLFCILAMKTKENALTLPIAIMIYEILFFRGSVKKRAIYLVPFLLTMLIIPLTYMVLNLGAGSITSAFEGATRLENTLSRTDYLFTQFRVVTRYISLFLFPVGQNIDHFQQIYHSLFDPPVLLSLIFLISVLCLGGYVIYRSRAANSALRIPAFGIFWFFLALSVESSIFPISEMMVEYRVYLPSAGAHIALASGAFLLTSRIRRKASVYTAAVLVLLVLSSATFVRNNVWENDFTLWEDSVKKSPKKARPYNNLGIAYLTQGKMDVAEKYYKKALELDPEHTEAYINLGSIYKAKGRMKEAIAHYETAVKCDPSSVDARIILISAYIIKGIIDKAEDQFQVALRMNPYNVTLFSAVGSVYLESGNADKAVEYFEMVLKLKPENLAIAHNNLGAAYQSKGIFEKAVEHYRFSAELEPLNPTGYFNLGNIYQSRGLFDNAIQLYQIALKLAPDHVTAYGNLGVAYQSKGMYDKAVEHYRAALDLDSSYVEAHYNLGLIYYQKGDTEKARGEFETALKLNPDYEKARESLEMINKKQ
jgi:tetratricopeptide (TPR) repeat protein